MDFTLIFIGCVIYFAHDSKIGYIKNIILYAHATSDKAMISLGIFWTGVTYPLFYMQTLIGYFFENLTVVNFLSKDLVCLIQLTLIIIF